MIIAPATLNTVAKIAHGFADNALTTLVLALRCPLLIAPAADVDMYQNKITIENIKKIVEAGYFIIEAEDGELASGLQGKGRFPGIEKIIDFSEVILSGYKKDLTGRKILVTAGPTYEDIDPVRFIGNRSSGKMGYMIAKAAHIRGAIVTLISGYSNEHPYSEFNLIKIRSAAELKKNIEKELIECDILVMSAAVADYKPEVFSTKKIKKEDELPEIKLTKTDDILASLDKKGKIVVGFALETDDELQNASNKLKSKNLDMIVMNSLKDNSSGFEVDSNKITVIHKSGKQEQFPLMSKFQAANKILSEILKITKLHD
jgi:phosphopantothenoylcysteine decarboxylase/phosphopantothenate--cysteine ligase